MDHFFICVSVDAPEADRLVELGLTEGSSNHHPGQGTANRRFFFRNAFLELLWVVDPAEAQSALVRPTGLWERWAGRLCGASPFGLGLRPAQPGIEGIPFNAWPYRPPYLPEPLAIYMSADSEEITEPLLFYLNFNRPEASQGHRRQPLDHGLGLREISRLTVWLPEGQTASAPLQAAERQCPCLNVATGSGHLLEVGFDGETQGQSLDLRTTLPVILRW